jgi:hypothetical protein
VLVLAALGVITCAQSGAFGLEPGAGFFQQRRLWLLIEAEFLAIVLVLVYVGAVMVLFLFVVMMLDINVEELRAASHAIAWLGWIGLRRDRADRRRGLVQGTRRDATKGMAPLPMRGLQQHQGARRRAVHGVRLSCSSWRRCCCWSPSSPPSR